MPRLVQMQALSGAGLRNSSRIQESASVFLRKLSVVRCQATRFFRRRGVDEIVHMCVVDMRRRNQQQFRRTACIPPKRIQCALDQQFHPAPNIRRRSSVGIFHVVCAEQEYEQVERLVTLSDGRKQRYGNLCVG